jgi:hypothetical protein
MTTEESVATSCSRQASASRLCRGESVANVLSNARSKSSVRFLPGDARSDAFINRQCVQRGNNLTYLGSHLLLAVCKDKLRRERIARQTSIDERIVC